MAKNIASRLRAAVPTVFSTGIRLCSKNLGNGAHIHTLVPGYSVTSRTAVTKSGRCGLAHSESLMFLRFARFVISVISTLREKA
jgi:hypothetical protein